MIGARLGPYEIVAPLGAGGMGEVYRARDSRLSREVAIKVLPPEYSADRERLSRFEQEARAAGMLNHPNILSIYDVGSHDGSPFVVAELLDGETLRQRLATAALSPRKAIDYALQIVRGLAAAHEMGIAHRDLKPENLFVTRDGRVKILDFGLAKLLGPRVGKADQTNAPTTPVRTESGMVMGTVGYMSPEQVRGQQADHRSDIFSFGSIFYEMLTGRRAFRGDSAIETMSAILKEEPAELSETNRALPPGLERVVRHCLEKNREERFQSASDLAFALEALSGFSSSGAVAVAPLRARPKLLPWLGRIAILAAVAAAAFWIGKGQRISVPTFHRLTFRRGIVSSARFAPDGQTIVYGAAWEGRPVEIFSARPESPESRPFGLGRCDILAISSGGEMAVTLGERGESTVARLPLAGGAPREVLERVGWADWSPDGQSLAVVRESGGRQRLEYPIGRTLFETAGWITHPRVSHDGRTVAFLEHPLTGDDRGSVALVDGAGRKRTLSREWRSIWGLAWSPDGREIWFSATQIGARALYATSSDGRERLVLRVPGRVTLEDIARDGHVLLTRDSVRVEMFGRAPADKAERELSWLDWSLVRDLSDDGGKVLFDESGEGGGENYAIYLRKTDGSPAVRLGEGAAMALSSDGTWALARSGISPSRLVLLPTGAGEGRALSAGSLSHQRASWFPDGKRILFSGNEPGHAPRLYVQDVGRGAPRVLSPEGVTGFWNSISPDGRVAVARRPDGALVLWPLDGSAPRPITGAFSDETPIRWKADGSALFLARMTRLPLTIRSLDVATGRADVWKQLTPLDSAGVTTISSLRMSSDGEAYAYSYRRILSDLYVVEGLK